MLVNMFRRTNRLRRRYLSMRCESMEIHSRDMVSQKAVVKGIRVLEDGVDERDIRDPTEVTSFWWGSGG